MTERIPYEIGDVLYNYDNDNLVVVDYIDRHPAPLKISLAWSGHAFYVDNKFYKCIKIGEL